jgi:hypothetical protein
MRLIPLVSAALVLSMSGPAFAQGWIQYVSLEDSFNVNFPSEPEVRDITYPTEYGVTLPGRLHSVDNGPNRYSVTVVDYGKVEEAHAKRLEGCGDQSRSNANLCGNPWVNELRGAMDYAAFGFLQRDATVTHYSYYNAERVEGRRIQLTNADRSRTFVAIHMHENRLYILEGTAPPGAPPPGLFQQSLGFIDEKGIRVRYDTIYANMYPAPPRVQYAEPVPGAAPDLAGVPMGGRRRFTEEPFAGQTWGVSGQGDVYLIQDADGRVLPLSGPRAAVPVN